MHLLEGHFRVKSVEMRDTFAVRTSPEVAVILLQCVCRCSSRDVLAEAGEKLKGTSSLLPPSVGFRAEMRFPGLHSKSLCQLRPLTSQG